MRTWKLKYESEVEAHENHNVRSVWWDRVEDRGEVLVGHNIT